MLIIIIMRMRIIIRRIILSLMRVHPMLKQRFSDANGRQRNDILLHVADLHSGIARRRALAGHQHQTEYETSLRHVSAEEHSRAVPVAAAATPRTTTRTMAEQRWPTPAETAVDSQKTRIKGARRGES